MMTREEIIRHLEKAIERTEQRNNERMQGKWAEIDAVYIPELTGEKVLTDRELYVYYRGWLDGLKALRLYIREAENEENLLDQLFREVIKNGL